MTTIPTDDVIGYVREAAKTILCNRTSQVVTIKDDAVRAAPHERGA